MVSKKRVVNGTTFPRYEEKAYAIHKGISGSDELARRTASAQLAQWQAGFGSLHEAWLRVKDAEILEGVPKIMYGLYHSATVQYASKVLKWKNERIRMVSCLDRRRQATRWWCIK
ncbi:hypothetical protein B9Q01_10735 [Candidatus Marsarchaeota G1 archaeon OSP_D]|jgi:hypothetical protein|uniref:Uncharacterized protein n=1 Tax=Candidatus Marsarchaeota G1 archaeon OSP_D TaxID=1978155 RepID=A0A2R6A5V1_9ARCH|nr:MAG: hypothetical protein B9Q01_10735 [Candidatus Marsarchaeota G1 archaeon OSP_D]